MEAMSKKKTSIGFMYENASLFICPVCGAPLKVREPFFSCERGHDNSIPRKGAPVLMRTSLKKSRIYDKTLFENRRRFIMGGFYGDVYSKIALFVSRFAPDARTALDIGCGEGSHTKLLYSALNGKVKLVGFDISHDAIELASDYLSPDIFFFVGDATNMPLANKSFDVTINFLSPYQAQEVRRTLKDDGIFIKVTPNDGYLCELREALELGSYNGAEDVRRAANAHFEEIASERVLQTAQLSKEQREAAALMTPLTKECALIENIPDRVTIDLNVTCYKLKKE